MCFLVPLPNNRRPNLPESTNTRKGFRKNSVIQALNFLVPWSTMDQPAHYAVEHNSMHIDQLLEIQYRLDCWRTISPSRQWWLKNHQYCKFQVSIFRLRHQIWRADRWELRHTPHLRSRWPRLAEVPLSKSVRWLNYVSRGSVQVNITKERSFVHKVGSRTRMPIHWGRRAR